MVVVDVLVVDVVVVTVVVVVVCVVVVVVVVVVVTVNVVVVVVVVVNVVVVPVHMGRCKNPAFSQAAVPLNHGIENLLAESCRKPADPFLTWTA